MAELIQKKLQGEVEKYQQLQKDWSKSMSGQQKLEGQLTENNIVKEELALLDGSYVVCKLLGPVLVRQELGEAQATVGKRLDYITLCQVVACPEVPDSFTWSCSACRAPATHL
uniref:Prefoldin subunit 6 n=1 Tax=Suricata suricatta TaxID=37032 RepID=A0A673UAJ9_SURSU